MAFEVGTYIILSALSSNLALDVRGASERSGTNVQVWTRNGGVAQIWAALSNSGGFRFVNPLSGKCLDVNRGTLANGTNVQQWESHSANWQRWDVTEDGKTLTVDGTDYPTYTITVHGSTFALDISGGRNKAGANVQIYTANRTDAQRWAFIPANVFTETEGTYKIISALDENIVLDVAGGSTANGANIQTYTDNGTKAQGWKIGKNTDGTVRIQNTKSGKSIDDPGGGVKPGTNAQQWRNNGTGNQNLLITSCGSMTVDGQEVPTYLIQLKKGQNLVLDVQGARTRSGTNVQFYTRNNSTAQQWAFVPATVLESNLPTPSNLTLLTQTANNATSATYGFYCAAEQYQCRMRFRKTIRQGQTVTQWSSWKGLDGVGGNEGWGDAWSANLTYDPGDDYKEFTITIPDDYVVDGDSVLSTEIEVELRSFSGSYSANGMTYAAHGAESAISSELSWEPTLEIKAVRLSGDGIHVDYSSDLNAGSCTMRASLLGQGISKSGAYGASGSVVFPAERLKSLTEIPSGSAYVSLSLMWGSSYAHASKTLAITDAANKLGLSATATETDYGTYKINIPLRSSGDAACVFAHMESSAATLTKLSQSNTEAVYESVPPLTTGGFLMIWVQRSDGWYINKVKLKPITSHAYVWVYSGGAAVLNYAVENPPKQEDNTSRSVEEYETIGREFHAYRLHKSKSRTLNVTGALVKGDTEHSSRTAFLNLLEAGHAVFRNTRGEVMNVCVTEISAALEHEAYSELTVTQNQESR